ncbi:MAG TPA: iron-containing redox enzyme family protein [Acidimicrobiales bacterium]|nr:iron-containing redox enzyme family protein [Acidimicrobiales bacterium]
MMRPQLDRILDDTLRDRRLLTHPFYRRWEAGELTLGELAAYAGQYRHFERALVDVLSDVVASLPAGPARDLVQSNLDDERGVPSPHLELFDEFLTAVGGDPAARATEATAALVASYRRLAAQPVGALAALAAYEVQAPAIATSKADGLLRHYGLAADATRFWDVHGTMDAHHADWTLDALAALDSDEATVRSAADDAAAAWWSFLDERESAAGLVTTA